MAARWRTRNGGWLVQRLDRAASSQLARIAGRINRT